jgi:hypothetical protein
MHNRQLALRLRDRSRTLYLATDDPCNGDHRLPNLCNGSDWHFPTKQNHRRNSHRRHNRCVTRRVQESEILVYCAKSQKRTDRNLMETV